MSGERKRVFAKADRTPEQAAELRAERERLGRDRPSLDDMIASGEVDPADVSTMGEYLPLLRFLKAMREERERQGLSLTDVSERSGLERSAISKLETGQSPNPNLSTLRRYAAALGKAIHFDVADLQPAGR